MRTWGGVRAASFAEAAAFDLIVLDVMLPDTDGFELCREIRSRPDLAAIKIIMCSSKSYDFDRRRAKELGADGYIVNDSTVEVLIEQARIQADIKAVPDCALKQQFLQEAQLRVAAEVREVRGVAEALELIHRGGGHLRRDEKAAVDPRAAGDHLVDR